MKAKLKHLTFLLLLYSAQGMAQNEAPYKGGAGDGYAMAELIIHEVPVGIGGNLAQELRVYPAPAKKGQDLFVHTGEAGLLSSLRFFDINGNLLFERHDVGYFQNLKEVKIQTENFPSGIYFLRAESRNGSITKRVIIL